MTVRSRISLWRRFGGHSAPCAGLSVDRLDGAPATGPNRDLAAVHRGLIALPERLGRQMDECTTVAQVDALATRIQLTTARITAVGSVLLAAQSSRSPT